MSEGMKFVGGLLAVVGIVLLFVATPVGVLVLAVVGILGVVSVIRTRESRHDELVQATQRGSAPQPPPVPEPQVETRARLTNLEKLRRDGLISEDEYEAKRSRIIDEI